MRLRGALLLAIGASTAAALMLAGPASAANLYCGETLTASVTLIGNLDCSTHSGVAITIAHDGVTLNLNGFKITGYAGYDVVYTDDYSGDTIKSGTLVVAGDGNGIDNGDSSNTMIQGVTITGDGTPGNDEYGVYSDGATAMSFTGGSVSGVDYGFYEDGDTGDLIKGNTITPNDGAYYGVYSDADNTGLQIVSNKFADADADQDGYAYYADYDAGTLFSGNTVTGMEYGVNDDEYSAGLTITGNVMDGNDYGIYFDEYGSGDMIAGNYIKNSVDEGIYDDESFNNTYNGNVLTSNGSTANDYTFDIEPSGYGPVTMVNNYARTGDGFGFYVYEAYNDSVPGGPYSLFTGNVATANGSSDDPGFYDEYSVGATWSKNVANSNATDGFDFCSPWRETVTGNSAQTNGGDGFYFEYDCGEAESVTPNNPGTIEDAQPLAVTNNSATNNGGYGFDGDFPIAGSGNTGGKTNVSGDCYLVAGCS